jgi:hypothetical protein
VIEVIGEGRISGEEIDGLLCHFGEGMLTLVEIHCYLLADLVHVLAEVELKIGLE